MITPEFRAALLARRGERPKMKFKTMKYADVSTRALTLLDLPLLRGPAPMLVASYPEGAFFYVPLDDQECFEIEIYEAREHGFSDKFIAIMRELRRQKIPYVCFDADGEEVG